MLDRLIEHGVPHLLLRHRKLYVLVPASDDVAAAVAGLAGVSVGASRPFLSISGWGPQGSLLAVSGYRAKGGPGAIPTGGGRRRLAAARHRRLLDLADRVLGPASRYDERRRTELLGSVRAWMKAGRRVDAASRELGVHPNTLAYRIKRFEKLTGRDLSITADMVDVWLALRAQEISAGSDKVLRPDERRALYLRIWVRLGVRPSARM
jgi:hypothetical protein